MSGPCEPLVKRRKGVYEVGTSCQKRDLYSCKRLPPKGVTCFFCFLQRKHWQPWYIGSGQKNVSGWTGQVSTNKPLKSFGLNNFGSRFWSVSYQVLGCLPQGLVKVAKASERRKGQWKAQGPVKNAKTSERRKGQWRAQGPVKGARASERRKGQWKVQGPVKGARASERRKNIFLFSIFPFFSLLWGSGGSGGWKGLRGLKGLKGLKELNDLVLLILLILHKTLEDQKD